MTEQKKFDPASKITDLRGKQYLEVKWRLVWFRGEHPNGAIVTETVTFDPLIIRAQIMIDGKIIATGHGSANADGQKKVWTGREIEKAETAAIGRALAHAGYGTQFTEDAEGDYLADAPIERAPAMTVEQAAEVTTAKGNRLGDLTPDQLRLLTEKGKKEEKHAAALLLTKAGK